MTQGMPRTGCSEARKASRRAHANATNPGRRHFGRNAWGMQAGPVRGPMRSKLSRRPLQIAGPARMAAPGCIHKVRNTTGEQRQGARGERHLCTNALTPIRQHSHSALGTWLWVPPRGFPRRASVGRKATRPGPQGAKLRRRTAKRPTHGSGQRPSTDTGLTSWAARGDTGVDGQRLGPSWLASASRRRLPRAGLARSVRLVGGSRVGQGGLRPGRITTRTDNSRRVVPGINWAGRAGAPMFTKAHLGD
jgi:hypothetical protein